MTTDVTDIISVEKDYYVFFAKAETHLKNAETFFPANIIEQGLLVPAINELRYAGFHAASALTLSGTEKIAAYQKAIAHCKRASYDSLDASIQFCFSMCQNFREDYRLIIVSDVIPDYSESRGRLDDIADDIKQHTTKDARWECMEEYFKEVNTISKRWENTREELNKNLRSERNKRWHNAILIVCAITAAIFGALAYFK